MNQNVKKSYFITSDGAKIYYEDYGKGDPILLIHGWTCSSEFWRSNIPELSENNRVITMDLRGHGNSSKILYGHSVTQYAKDIRALIEHLSLTDLTLLGWSLSGPVVLSYWEQYASDSRLQGIGIIDSTVCPFSPSAWNSHGLKNYNTGAMHEGFKALTDNPGKYAEGFTKRMFKDETIPAEDIEWITREIRKTPPWIAIAIFSDYLLCDFTGVLQTINIPAIVFAADSGIFQDGIEQGKYIASRIPDCMFVPFEKSGHMMFYEEPAEFNAALLEFTKKNASMAVIVANKMSI